MAAPTSSRRPPGRPPKRTSAQIEAALRACGGVVAHAAKKLGIGRNAVSRRLDREPRLAEVREEALETLVDDAESALAKMVRNAKHPGHLQAVLGVLKLRGARRGWLSQSRVEAELSGDKAPRIVLYVPEKAPLPDDGSGPDGAEPTTD